MPNKYERMTKAELVRRLAALEEMSRAELDAQAILHDLHVHQEEVRAQNEELIEIKQTLELSRDRYADLYDFAPIAYLTMDPQGVIEEINLTGSGLLGLDRGRIVGTPFGFYVEGADKPKFMEHMRRCRDAAGGGEDVWSEVRLGGGGGRAVQALLP